ncbi:peptidylprolyl isomerase fpr3 [Friedmanniomyces endolithicus]|uniref:peptidylprolyl isomerase n=1 Tax=Friedmanniomyces endolithicus TaxID=329885 RepID=A0A4U0V9Q6_9PEZI|nr:peptidylprolyl isomerase fpr3 [Friedmanniomyces endolithicus]KAK0268854.1 peptidylprolyl isomerase fpr3 [Friedmanniomyces endolithicus]KAK0299954.1 peptidylprolyl isomerase fpr3 [Friedmanniomyces endolithicus]KAK0307597.1 peptidylprolyl isomerase fpr3 [Friedmanniomyces endolithicus]KAK0318041.1 peptidylprolyl isomerase fpr3 [Friedmanniomyces endolithicus]
MSGMLPMAMFGQEVIPDDVAVIAGGDVPAAFRITMAAIDPTAAPLGDEGAVPRATLKIIRQPLDASDMYDEDDSDDSEDFDADEMDAMLGGNGEDSEDEDEDEDANGGPSDPSKTKQARVIAALKKLGEVDGMDVDDDDDDDEAPKTNGVNGVSKSIKAKGKMPASDEDEDEEDSEDGEDEIEEFVICTLDPEKNYQQPLDLTIGEKEMVFFKVTGTHSIYLTGNYVAPDHDHQDMYDPDDESDEDYDLEPSEDELDEMDALDDMEDPRITEVAEEDDAPKLIAASKKAAEKKGADKNANKKRPAEEEVEPQTLDEMIQKESAGEAEPKLSKKQLKKQKKNDGTAAIAPKAGEETAEAPSSGKSDRKVSFAKDLEQGPTANKDAKPTEKTADKEDKSKATLGVKTIQGVTIDDKKLGTGPAAKKGDRVGMRYIGKLQKDGKQFDSNKKGKPFSFKLGTGEVIKGWDIGVVGMSVGSERRITIPAHLAYGSKGAGKDIPPNSTLVFDVKVIELNKGK